jgi:hypothetical protein
MRVAFHSPGTGTITSLAFYTIAFHAFFHHYMW